VGLRQILTLSKTENPFQFSNSSFFFLLWLVSNCKSVICIGDLRKKLHLATEEITPCYGRFYTQVRKELHPVREETTPNTEEITPIAEETTLIVTTTEEITPVAATTEEITPTGTRCGKYSFLLRKIVNTFP
jgi:hypothetical protein